MRKEEYYILWTFPQGVPVDTFQRFMLISPETANRVMQTQTVCVYRFRQTAYL